MNEDEAFFKILDEILDERERMQECRGPYRLLGECYSEILANLRGGVYDIGCGIGAQCERMAELGHTVFGIDSPEASKHKVGTNWRFLKADLTTADYSHYMPKSVCICTETGEHLPEEKADHLVLFVSALARRRIIWSAAQPGQEWPGHINLQKPEYWLEKFRARGWVTSNNLTTRLRSLMAKKNAQHIHCRENFFVLTPDHFE